MSTEKKPFVPKTAMDFQKLKLERLMANPDKLVMIPDIPKEKRGFSVPEFVRNVMGSSAGAGSGEFHVYRHLRRKEYTRQKVIEEKAETEKLDDEFRMKLEENKRKMEEKTAKRRTKRLKKKQKMKLKKKGIKDNKGTEKQMEDSSEESEDEIKSDHGDFEQKKKSDLNTKYNSSYDDVVELAVDSIECSISKESVS